jgi:hypothetical protein
MPISISSAAQLDALLAEDAEAAIGAQEEALDAEIEAMLAEAEAAQPAEEPAEAEAAAMLAEEPAEQAPEEPAEEPAEEPEPAEERLSGRHNPGPRRFPKAAEDALNLEFANAAQALADEAGLRSRYHVSEAAEFRLRYRASMERGGVVQLERGEGEASARIPVKALREYIKTGDKAMAARLRPLAEGPKLLGRKLAIYALAAAQDKALREALSAE